MVTEKFYTEEYLKNCGKVFNYLRRKCGDVDLSGDLTQTTWTRAWEYREHFRGESQFLTWVVAIANSVWRDYLRYKKPTEQFSEGFDVRSCECVEEDAAVNESMERLEKMLDYLSSADQRLILARMSEVPLEVIAAETGTNVNTVKTRSRRAVEKLKTMAARA